MEEAAVKVKEKFQIFEPVNKVWRKCLKVMDLQVLSCYLKTHYFCKILLIAGEKHRCLDDQIDLESPNDNQPLRIIGCY